ncbi:uncharacterized protein LOC144326728 [Podarcis muralis]
MKLLRILVSGINYLILLLFSIFLAATGVGTSGNITTGTTSPPAAPVTNSTILPVNTANTTRTSLATTASSTVANGNQPSNTSDDAVLLMSITTSAGAHVETDIAMPGTEMTQSPEDQPVTFWGIILLSLAVTAAITAGFIGCFFFFCRRNNL